MLLANALALMSAMILAVLLAASRATGVGGIGGASLDGGVENRSGVWASVRLDSSLDGDQEPLAASCASVLSSSTSMSIKWFDSSSVIEDSRQEIGPTSGSESMAGSSSSD